MVMLPGLKKHGIIKKYFSSAIDAVAGMAKSVVGPAATNGNGDKKKE